MSHPRARNQSCQSAKGGDILTVLCHFSTYWIKVVAVVKNTVMSFVIVHCKPVLIGADYGSELLYAGDYAE